MSKTLLNRLRFTLFIFLVMTALSTKVLSQSTCIYLTDDQTYVNATDGGNIKFYSNGEVAIDGKIDKDFSFKHVDCEIRLYYKKKLVNTLTHSAGYFDYKGETIPDKYNCDCLIDNRKVVYTHLVKRG